MNAETQFLSWMAGAQTLALLKALTRRGALDLLKQLVEPETFASRLSITPEHALRILMALEAAGVVEREGGTYSVASGWQEIARPDRPASLADRLGFSDPVQVALETALDEPVAFGNVPLAESLALAKSVWGTATSAEALRSWATLDDAMPEIRDLWRAGARHAEFGCGAGRDLVRVAAMYPDVSVVGYDILDRVLDEARDLAIRAGVSDRVDLRLENVLELDAREAFDTIMWSHMFFAPGAVRDGALATIGRTLKPGGYVIIPFMRELPAPDAVTADTISTFVLTVAVAYRRWNIYWPGADDLRQEMEREGFRHVATIPHPRTPFMALQKT